LAGTGNDDAQIHGMPRTKEGSSSFVKKRTKRLL
jgi:hypothetical protein